MKSITPLRQKPPRKRTEKQKLAARANGAKSQGPKTEAGKLKSSGNAMLHGVYSLKHLRMNMENSEQFTKLLALFSLEWQPAGPTQATLVRSLALESLALDRFRALEAAALDSMFERTSNDNFIGPPALHEKTYAGFEEYTEYGHLPALTAIDRIIARCDRTFRASLTSLLQLRKVGQASPPVQFDSYPPPPVESSESLERRIAEFKAQEEAEKAAAGKREQTNPASVQTTSNQPLPAPAKPGKAPHPVLYLPAPPSRPAPNPRPSRFPGLKLEPGV